MLKDGRDPGQTYGGGPRGRAGECGSWWPGEFDVPNHPFTNSPAHCYLRSLCGDRDAFHREDFDGVADTEVVELVEADTTLEAGLDLAHVVLEATQ